MVYIAQSYENDSSLYVRVGWFRPAGLLLIVIVVVVAAAAAALFQTFCLFGSVCLFVLTLVCCRPLCFLISCIIAALHSIRKIVVLYSDKYLEIL